MNLNDMAVWVANNEAGKKEISIAQIKEVMKLVFEYLSGEDVIDVLKTIRKYE